MSAIDGSTLYKIQYKSKYNLAHKIIVKNKNLVHKLFFFISKIY